MTTQSLKRFERILLDERRRAAGDLVSAERDLQADSAHVARGSEAPDQIDVVSSRMAADIDARIVERESAELEDIDAALRELYHTPEHFGRCEICHRPIGEARLSLLPTTRRCSRHGRDRVRLARG